MIEQLKPHLSSKESLMKLFLFLLGLFGGYLLVAWVSYSPLDNGWTISSTLTSNVLNKTGSFGAWVIDLLYALFGKVTVLIPMLLIISSIYSLVMGIAKELKWKTLAFRFFSGVLLLIGLAGLSSVLLSHSANYLSGGFIGGVWQGVLGESLGQFLALFIAIAFVVVGLYFCSAQSLLPILSRFYDWLMVKTEHPVKVANTVEKTAESVVSPLQNSAENTPLVATGFSEQTVQTEPQFTDLNVFKRPNISGLKPVVEDMSSEPTFGVNLAQQNGIEMFQPERDLSLPAINIQTPVTEVEPLPLQHEVEEQFAPSSSEVKMPQIRLNPMLETPVPEAIVPAGTAEIKVAMPSLAPEPMPAVEPVKVAITTNEEYDDSEDEEIEKTEISQTATPSFITSPTPVMEDIKERKEQPSYPKGYGDTLIHPLLQRNTVMEKPTTPLPTLDLLDPAPLQSQQITEQEIRATSARLEEELANFGVKATVEDVLVGPVVTRYEIQPAAGVKASKITGLASDIARGLMFKAIRITEVIPNKPYMGIETPNKHRETVWLRDVLDSEAFRNTTATLPMALGKDISGEPIVVDMAKMPHLLVAGQTGGGKSVGVNTMILSLLFKLTPEQVRFIMIDPKVVELSIYNDIPHLLTPVVTDMKKAANALRWAVEEMERRYLLVSHLQVRNIEGYNDKIDQAAAMNLPIPDPTWRPSDSMDKLPPPLQKLSYIVLIVDEFADLMMSAGKEVEEYIMRIAQKARAVGIHLILATQRPSTDVITGVIKANIPSRIAFTVASQIDSRTILDTGGAEALLGRGDMLYSGAGSPDIIRVHGAFMKDEEVQRVADNWRARGKPNYLDSIVNTPESETVEDLNEGDRELDPLFDKVVEYSIQTGTITINNVQRRFGIGFPRAARIVDQMEMMGIVSEAGKGGKREVLAQ